MSHKGSQVYVTNFSSRTTEDDLMDEFKKYGKVSEINLKRSFAFVSYHDYHDAEEAIRKLDKTTLDGKILVVEAAGAKKPRVKGPQTEDKCFQCGRKGHWANECKEKSRRGRSNSRSHSRSRSRSVRRDRKSRRRHSPSRSRSRRSYSSSRSPSRSKTQRQRRYSKGSRSASKGRSRN